MSFVKLPLLRHGFIARDADVLTDQDVAARIERARRLMSEKGVESLLAYGDPTLNGPVCYLTNYPCFGLGRRATVVLGMTEGPFLFTAEPSRNLPKVRLLTTCDLEKTREFLTMGCERAKKLAGKGRIGLVGMSDLPAGLVKNAASLEGAATEDLTFDFSLILAAKDAGAIRAQRRAIGLAGDGLRHLRAQLREAGDLWERAAYVDYRLRLAGCEDTHILLNCGARGKMRPAYPPRIHPQPGDKLIAYVAAQYARHWGVMGRTLTVGPDDPLFDGKMDLLKKVQATAPSVVKGGMTVSGIAAALGALGREAGLTFVKDIDMATGVGFDLHEYPLKAEDRVEEDMVLQVALAVDFDEGSTGMLVDMLRVGESSSTWISGAMI